MLGVLRMTVSFVSWRPLRLERCETALKALVPLAEEQLTAIRAWEEQEEVIDGKVRDEKIRAAGFPIAPEELIQRAKLYLAINQYGVEDAGMLADEFRFVGHVIGPLDKATFIKQLGQFDLRAAFPDQKVRWHDFRVDPFEPSRVWFTGRSTGTNLGPLLPLVQGPTNKAFESPPEACSLRFNADGQVVEYTAAHVMDRQQGNTGGLGGLLGPLYAIDRGFPFPEAQPYEWSWQRKLFSWLGSLLAGQ